MKKRDLKQGIIFTVVIISVMFAALYPSNVKASAPDYFNNPEVVWVHEGFEPERTDFYTLQYRCMDEVCIRGRKVEFEVNISNSGNKPVRVKSIRALDSSDFKTIAFGNKSTLVYSLVQAPEINRTNYIEVDPNERKTIKMYGILPEANDGDYLNFRFCVTLKSPLDSWKSVSKQGYSEEYEYCYSTIYRIIVKDCERIDECAEDETCISNDCVKIECGECQYISEHGCHDYECCYDSECKLDEACEENECVTVECNSDENRTMYLVNHTCTETPCPNGSVLQNFTCIKKECRYDQKMVNYTCIDLECKDYESILDHECVKLQCAEDEYAFNHSCVKLRCSDSQEYFNHTCRNIKCGIYRKAMYHKCVFNTLLIIETVLLFVIIGLALLDYHKYESRYRKQLVFLLMRETKLRQLFKKVAEEEEKKLKEQKPEGGNEESSESKDNSSEGEKEKKDGQEENKEDNKGESEEKSEDKKAESEEKKDGDDKK